LSSLRSLWMCRAGQRVTGRARADWNVPVRAILIRGKPAPATALVIVRWKPSAGSRSLSGISSHEQPHRPALAQIVARSGDYGLRPASSPRPSSPPGETVCGGWAPTIQRRDSLWNQILPGGLKGRGPLAANAVSGVASATSICAGGAESADMSLSDRQRSEGFQLIPASPVLSAVDVSFTAPSTKAPDTYTSENLADHAAWTCHRERRTRTPPGLGSDTMI